MNDLPTPSFPGVTPPTTDFGAVRSQLRTQPLYTVVDLASARAFSANSQQVLSIGGNFIYCDPALSTGVATGYFMSLDGKATPITLYPGAAFDVPFTSLTIENTAQPGASLRLIYGTDIAFRPANAAGVSILNAISVIDAGYQRTVAGQAFAGGVQSAAAAANNSHVQLFNPAGSTVNVVVRKYGFTVQGASQVYLNRYDTQLTTDNGSAQNKLAGGAVSVAKMRSQTNVGTLGTGNPLGYWFDVNAQRVVMETLTEPIVLIPGTGILFVPLTVNIGMWGMFDWYEQAR